MFRIFVASGVLAAAVACAPPPWEDSGTRGADEAPTVRILFPETSVTTQYCSTFTVVVETERFELSEEQMGAAPRDGQGHWQLWEGDDCATELLGASGSAFFTLQEPLTPGTHVLYAELVTNDHQPLEPRIVHRSSILVSASADECEGGDRGWGDR